MSTLCILEKAKVWWSSATIREGGSEGGKEERKEIRKKEQVKYKTIMALKLFCM